MRNVPPPPDNDATVIRRAGAPVEAPAPQARVPLTGVLRGVSGEIHGKVWQVYDKLLIGRDERCDVVIPIGEVSRQHARIDGLDGKVVIHDLGSSNGTRINGNMVRDAELENGDEIAIHTARLRYEIPGALPKARPAPGPTPAASPIPAAAAPAPGGNKTLIIVAAVAVVIAIAAVAVLLLR